MYTHFHEKTKKNNKIQLTERKNAVDHDAELREKNDANGSVALRIALVISHVFGVDVMIIVYDFVSQCDLSTLSVNNAVVSIFINALFFLLVVFSLLRIRPTTFFSLRMK